MIESMLQIIQPAQLAFPEPVEASVIAPYLFVSAAMFVIGLVGFLTRKNMIIMFLCTELMFQAAGLALIAFGRHDVRQARDLSRDRPRRHSRPLSRASSVTPDDE